ncbi:hypothetical protein C8R45DRAFT_1076911 [Mycena sanguinolenta]|nr:hypothetical protein C8R45DRAFT_1076911 [Mycena sanguinolenta]
MMDWVSGQMQSAPLGNLHGSVGWQRSLHVVPRHRLTVALAEKHAATTGRTTHPGWATIVVQELPSQPLLVTAVQTIYAPDPPCSSSPHAPSTPQVSCSERNTRGIQPRQRCLQHSGTLAKHKAAVRRVTAGGIPRRHLQLAAGRVQEVADVARCSNYVK